MSAHAYAFHAMSAEGTPRRLDPAPSAAAPAAGPKMLRIAASGVSTASPLGKALVAALQGVGTVVPYPADTQRGGLWRWVVRGTMLDWCGSSEPTAEAAPDIVLDLAGSAAAAGVRTWRVIDEFGNGPLHPLSCLAASAAAPFVKSLYLIERRNGSADWHVLAEAHLSNRRGSRHLLDTIGRTVAWLVSMAARRSSDEAAAFEQAARSPGLGNVLQCRLAWVRTWWRDHAGSEIWAIGRCSQPLGSFLKSQTMRPDSWIEVPRQDGFVADPFPWPGHAQAILYERFSHRTGRGTIEALAPIDGPGRRVGRLDPHVASHLSYPFTYAEGDRVVCLPEMAGAGRQTMYELRPDGSLHEMCVVADFPMADPTLFRYGNYYWLAYSDVALGHQETLSLRFAAELEGPWTPHPLNPVKIDVRSSRPAGAPFGVGGALFRPAQDCTESYGCAVAINRIVACNPEQYQEVQVARLTPDPVGRYPHGLHTFSVTPNGILLDGKRVVYSPRITWQRLRRRLRRPAGRDAAR